MVERNSLILSMKVLLISAGVLSVAIGIKFSIPIAMNAFPVVSLWLKPPYLYLIINGIIISIAAVSRFHNSQSEQAGHSDQHFFAVKSNPQSSFPSFPAQSPIETFKEENSGAVFESDDRFVDVKAVIVNGSKVVTVTEEQNLPEIEREDVFTDNNSQLTYSGSSLQEKFLPEVRQLESVLPVREKPLLSSRFSHRKPIRSTPEASGGRVLRVSRPKKQETLESTWKAITEGRHVPLTRHHKKSESWDQPGRHIPSVVDHHVLKSETFNDRTSRDSSLKIRKEPSLGQDELNRRVEAFIKKFNDDMRIQRQESLNQYMEMINRGV